MGGTFLVEQPGSSMMEEFCRFKAMCERLRVPWTRFDGGYMLYIPWNCVQGFEAYNYIYISIFAFGFPSGKCLGKYRVVDWWVCIYNIAVALPRHRFTSARGGWPTMVLSARRGRRHLATQNIFTGCVAESLQPPSGPNAPSRLLWKPNLVASKGARISDLLSILAACHTMENLSIEFIVRCMGYI